MVESLKGPIEAAAYIDTVFEDGDFDHILLALKNVAEARKGLIETSSKVDADWENYYQSLVHGETPGLTAIAKLLSQFSLKLSMAVQQKRAA